MSLSISSRSPPTDRSPPDASSPSTSGWSWLRSGGPGEGGREGRLAPLSAAFALGAILVLEAALPLDGVTPGPPGLAARRARPVDIPPPVRVQALFDAPIFAPDRRPVARADSGATQGSPMAGYAVGGVALGPGGAVAVVSLPGNSTQLVHVGDHVGDWRVAAIARTRVAFERQGRRHDLIVGAPAAPVITPDAQAQEGANPQ